jgi:hypothetical protein
LIDSIIIDSKIDSIHNRFNNSINNRLKIDSMIDSTIHPKIDSIMDSIMIRNNYSNLNNSIINHFCILSIQALPSICHL